MSDCSCHVTVQVIVRICCSSRRRVRYTKFEKDDEQFKRLQRVATVCNKV